MAPTTTTLQLETFTAAPEAFSVTSTIVTGERRRCSSTRSSRSRGRAPRRADPRDRQGADDDLRHALAPGPLLRAAGRARRVPGRPRRRAARERRADPRQRRGEGRAVEARRRRPDPGRARHPGAADGTLGSRARSCEIVLVGQADAPGNTAVHVRSADTLIAGDFLYNGTHVWLSETGPAEWEEWLANVDRLEAIGASRVVAGHRAADAIDDARVREHARVHPRLRGRARGELVEAGAPRPREREARRAAGCRSCSTSTRRRRFPTPTASEGRARGEAGRPIGVRRARRRRGRRASPVSARRDGAVERRAVARRGDDDRSLDPLPALPFGKRQLERGETLEPPLRILAEIAADAVRRVDPRRAGCHARTGSPTAVPSRNGGSCGKRPSWTKPAFSATRCEALFSGCARESAVARSPAPRSTARAASTASVMSPRPRASRREPVADLCRPRPAAR